ncbi:spore coat protein GerQ [Paenibacillus aurantius]|uniref:Spore coat protein GerQ n=1 Tax=Paenibacillus aurantius TaxID=2918900 RepID=A0AA96LG46_9BACL|nr:spore coat protein GerQ [Paenibacillus aurantius]WNQ12604.1 spore coat protein GerQ [Paenibacillus aurantius]
MVSKGGMKRMMQYQPGKTGQIGNMGFPGQVGGASNKAPGGMGAPGYPGGGGYGPGYPGMAPGMGGGMMPGMGPGMMPGMGAGMGGGMGAGMMPGMGMSPTSTPPPVPSGAVMTPSGGTVASAEASQPPLEQSYIENILRMNLGKTATLYMTYENNKEWNAKIFKGRLEAAGRDHIIISDPQTGTRFLLLMVNLDYITFEGPLNYSLSFGSAGGGAGSGPGAR